jgi:glycosyltransferase involved in cell wall biosynthesis
MAKGFAIYDKLDKFCNKFPKIAQFRFLGNCPDRMLQTCQKLSPQPYKEIPRYLTDQDLYVTATQFESGGCHIIEGMGCGLIPMVRHGGGGTEEYSNGYAKYYSEFDELEEHIMNLYNDYDMFVDMRKHVREDYVYGAMDMCEAYTRAIEDE